MRQLETRAHQDRVGELETFLRLLTNPPPIRHRRPEMGAQRIEGWTSYAFPDLYVARLPIVAAHNARRTLQLQRDHTRWFHLGRGRHNWNGSWN